LAKSAADFHNAKFISPTAVTFWWQFSLAAHTVNSLNIKEKTKAVSITRDSHDVEAMIRVSFS